MIFLPHAKTIKNRHCRRLAPWMARGIERSKVFRNNADMDQFLEGLSMSLLAARLGISIPSISDSVARGQMIAKEKGLKRIKD